VDKYVGIECPTIYLIEYEWLIDLGNDLRKGIFPYGGGRLDQPSLLMEALKTFNG